MVVMDCMDSATSAAHRNWYDNQHHLHAAAAAGQHAGHQAQVGGHPASSQEYMDYVKAGSGSYFSQMQGAYQYPHHGKALSTY